MPSRKRSWRRSSRTYRSHVADLRLSAAALQDLGTIKEDGVRQHGQAATTTYLSGFDRLFRLLRDHPKAGQARPEFRGGYRSPSHRPFLIVYRIKSDAVVIERILHHARDVRRALRDEH